MTAPPSSRPEPTERSPREGYPVKEVTTLDAALSEASWICFASHSLQAVIYFTSTPGIADPETGERYLIFREDDPTRHHLKDDWQESYTLAGKRSP